jgi:hypothetical protein
MIAVEFVDFGSKDATALRLFLCSCRIQLFFLLPQIGNLDENTVFQKITNDVFPSTIVIWIKQQKANPNSNRTRGTV